MCSPSKAESWLGFQKYRIHFLITWRKEGRNLLPILGLLTHCQWKSQTSDTLRVYQPAATNGTRNGQSNHTVSSISSPKRWCAWPTWFVWESYLGLSLLRLPLSLPSLKSCIDSHVYYYHTTYIGKWLGMVSQCCKPVLVGRGNGWERVKVGKIHTVKKRSRRTVPAMPFYPILKLPHRWIGKVAVRVPNTIFTSEFAEFTPRADWIISRYVMLWMFMASYLPMP